MNENKKISNPLVSICIPVFNGASLIFRALESCINQTYKNIEVIVVDNASSDRTKEIVLKYAQKDPRIKYFRNETNIGPVLNLHKSFQLASGDFIQFLCHDDWLSRNYIEEGVRNFQLYSETAAVFSQIIALTLKEKEVFQFDQEITLPPKNYPIDYYFKIVYKSQFGANDVFGMFKKEDVLRAQPFVFQILEDPNYGQLYKEGLADRLFIPQIFLNYKEFTYTDKSAYFKVEHTNNLGKQWKLKPIEQFIDAGRRSFEIVYTKEMKKYLLSLRVYCGTMNITNAIVDYIKNNFNRQYLNIFNKETLSFLYRDYSLLEKLLVAISILPCLVLRTIKFTIRKLKKKKRMRFPLTESFLDAQGKFSVY